MDGVNILGTILGLLGFFLIFLGVTGRYQLFIPASSSSGNNNNNGNNNGNNKFNPFPPYNPGSGNPPGLLPPPGVWFT